MSPPLEPIDCPRIERREAFRAEFVVGPATGLFTKLLSGAAALLLLAVGLLGVLLRLAWVRHRATRASRV